MFFEVSAKTGDRIDELFNAIASSFVEKVKAEPGAEIESIRGNHLNRRKNRNRFQPGTTENALTPNEETRPEIRSA
jgi:hypothetical protein